MNILVRLFSAFIDVLRPQLGPRGVCIYPVSCRTYAKGIIKEKPLPIAVGLIGKRLFFCNPITGLLRRWR